MLISPFSSRAQETQGKNLCSPFRYLVALGTNMGDRQGHLDQAVALIERDLGPIVAQSPVWETPPVGPADRLFLNAALICETDKIPEDMMLGLLGIESVMGRVRRERWGNRIIDLDLLLGIDKIGTSMRSETKVLTLPHPTMLERDFVLLPATAIAGEWIHPETGQSLTRAMLELQRKEQQGN